MSILHDYVLWKIAIVRICMVWIEDNFFYFAYGVVVIPECWRRLQDRQKVCGHCSRTRKFQPKPFRGNTGGGRSFKMRPVSVSADA